ncbi:MAG: SRPBCC family protein [Segniliparus sp.]|uniref:SRPBCC family protein n=1 Tax=Segniliparus sp. TaxID=2804064 RepID=UPI003F349450
MPSYSHTLEVHAPAERVFAVLDDMAKTPLWLKRCTQIDKLDQGPNAVGTRLRYHYKDGGRAGVMEGSIVALVPGRQLTMSYTDKMMDVTVDFVAAPSAEDRASLTHTVTIETKGFGKLVTPMVKRQLPGQTIDAMTSLKALVESGETL